MKLGRKAKKIPLNLLFQYLKNENGSLRQQARKKHLTPAGFQKQILKILQNFNKHTPWPKIPNGKLILIADAMIEYIKGKPHVFYFMLLRSLHQNKAVIRPFVVTCGSGEGFAGWYSAIKFIPHEIHKKIKVLVCDGVQALTTISREQGWILQRCQFHLQARIAHYCSTRRFGKRPKLGKRIQKLVRIVLVSHNAIQLRKALSEIDIIRKKVKARSFRTVLSGFLKHYEDYRSYLRYPEYHIPTTSNSVEFLIGQIRDLQYRARGFRTLRSLSSWIEAYCKFTKKITCNGKISLPN